MTSNNKLLLVGIGASLAAAYCTYRMTNRPKQKSARNKKFIKVRDVDGNSEEGLSDVEIEIINGEESITQDDPIDKFTEASVPLSRVNYQRQKQIIRGEDTVTVTSWGITQNLPQKFRKGKRGRKAVQKEPPIRDLSVDSEEEKFQQWQREREQHLKEKNFTKNDRIYTEDDVSTKENEHNREKRKLCKFIKDYQKERSKVWPGKKTKLKDMRSHFSELNLSLPDMVQSENGSAIEKKSGKSKNSLVCEEVQKKSEENFFDIFLAISKPIVYEKKTKKYFRRR
jgi:hypothetical protein